MKQILVIDESSLLREYLKLKLDNPEVEVTVAINTLDGISKLRTQMPDLIIMDYHLKKNGCLDVLKQKKESPNTVNTPVIIMARYIGQNRLIELVSYDVKKVFTKPVKIDALCGAITKILGLTFDIDETPGIVEVHANDDIIFVEIAQGLNRDKLDLLYFKIRELIVLYEIRLPKIIVMLSDITLGFADAPNIEKLLEVVLKSSGAAQKNIRVLTRDAFLRKYIEGQWEYADIEVISSLQYAMNGLFENKISDPVEYDGKEAEILEKKVLSADNAAKGEFMHLRFETEEKIKWDDIKDLIKNSTIAAVDDDFSIQELIKNTFKSLGTTVKTYSDGASYLADAETEVFDLVFLDLLMPNIDGFDVLRSMRIGNKRPPVIVLSVITQRDTVIQAFQLGIKSYLVKPLKPDDILKKTAEILRASF
ncbi:MAG: response regulator [Spirochaetaceae bacterium]|jgi:DNA-binding response OmpR family regulator|nr:response regulator [Spirochaetaceae bacterium]